VTVLFDHRSHGTPEEAWAASERLSACQVVGLPASVTRLVVLAAHPDDETLGAGGLIATAARSGLPVEVIIATAGEASHPDSHTHSPGALARIRRVEADTALAALASAATLTFLGLSDGALAAQLGVLADVLRPRLDAGTLLVTPWSGDRHPDHEACAAAGGVAAAARRCLHWQYPIWAWHWADPQSADLPWSELRRVDVDRQAAAAKQAAVAAYVSQHEALSALPGDEAILPQHVTAHFEREYETFVVAPAPAATPDYFEELYARSDDPWGLRDRFYEQRKRDLVCAALTRERMAAMPNVTIDHRRIPQDWPTGPFDLLVLSEVGYYCPDLGVLSERIHAELAPDGVVVACHWRHDAPDHPHPADDVHRAVGAGLKRIVSHVEEDFLLDVWARSGESVARSSGIVA